MRYARKILLIIILMLQIPAFCQHKGNTGKEVPSSYCISPMEFKLYTMINDYRARYDLPPIPLSKSLCYVASMHAKDLFLNHPDQNSQCNSHSWSAKGFWKPFCYPRDESKKSSVWDKPKELTRYKGKGYEIVYWENNVTVIDSIIAFWKSMDYFNSFLMNTGKWKGKQWNAIGISIYENYAAAWFGEIPDQEPVPVICGTVPVPDPVKKIVAPVVIKDPDKKDAAVIKPHEPQAKPEVLKVPSGRYYLVVRSQSPRTEMVKALEDLKSQGYQEAKLLEKDHKLRLSVQDYKEKSSADSALREIKKTMKDAWMLKF